MVDGSASAAARATGGGTVTVMTDITQQKQAERELVEAKQRTEEANKLITEKNRTLEALASELRDKNRKVEEQAVELAEWNATLETRVAEQVSQIGRYSRLTRFLSPKVSDLIMSGDSDEPLKARRSEVTVVYVDLRGFTGFTETAEPEEVMSVLRQYHSELGRIITEHDGTIEHFAGDGMMVLFNAPMPVENHELRAVHMALAMREVSDDPVGGLAQARSRARLRRRHRRRLCHNRHHRLRATARLRRDRPRHQSRRAPLRGGKGQADPHCRAHPGQDRGAGRGGGSRGVHA